MVEGLILTLIVFTALIKAWQTQDVFIIAVVFSAGIVLLSAFVNFMCKLPKDL